MMNKYGHLCLTTFIIISSTLTLVAYHSEETQCVEIQILNQWQDSGIKGEQINVLFNIPAAWWYCTLPSQCDVPACVLFFFLSSLLVFLSGQLVVVFLGFFFLSTKIIISLCVTSCKSWTMNAKTKTTKRFIGDFQSIFSVSVYLQSVLFV